MRGMVIAAVALLLCGCGGDAAPAEEGGAASPARETAAPTPAPSAPREVTAEPAPTAADSTTAAAEDVSPEWKQRARTMESFASCMAKTREAPEAVRSTLEAACRRLPDAPR